MALSNLLESYISSIDTISSSLNGVDDHLCHETFSEICEFYSIYDAAHSAYEYLEKNSFTDDCAVINESLLSKCNDCNASLEQYRKQDDQNIEGYKKILSLPSKRRIKATLTEYEQKIKQVKDRHQEIAECQILMKKCDIALSETNLLDKSGEINSLKEYLKSVKELTLSEVDEFIKKVSFSKIKKSRQTLQNILDSKQIFVEYYEKKNKFIDFLKTNQHTLITFKQNISKSTLENSLASFFEFLKIKNTTEYIKIKDAYIYIDDLITQIESFQIKTLNPLKEFDSKFKTAELEKTIDTMVAKLISEMNSKLKKKRLMVALFITAIILGLIVILNPSILDYIIHGLIMIGYMIVALVVVLVVVLSIAAYSENKKDK